MAMTYLGENLVFIISQPRAGSTLLQRILGSHSEIAISSEPWLMLHPVYGTREQGITAEYSADWAARGVNEFLENYTDGPEVYDDGIRAFAQTVYFNAMARGNGRYFVDKTPRYLMILKDLLRLFPQAKFVFLLRNPLSVLASVVNSQVSHDLYTLERFREELLDGPQAMLKAMQELGEQAIKVRYEEFVTEPEKHTARVCAAIGVEYEPAMLNYSESVPVKGFMQDRTGIDQHERPSDTRIESWQQLLTDAQQVHFAQSYLRTLDRNAIEQLGYSYDELSDAIRAAAERHRGGRIMLPWKVALLHPDEAKGLDQVMITRYRNIRDRGIIIANLFVIKSLIKGMWRACKIIFGRADFDAERHK
jgi:hypothetical protein